MKKVFTLLTVAISIAVSSQVSPVVGLRYTGGLQYKADHEYPSIELGIYVKPETEYKLMHSYFATVEVLNDYSTFYSNQITNTKRDLEAPFSSKFGMIIRMQNNTKIVGSLGLTTILGVGGTIEKNPAPLFTYGVGLSTLDLPFNMGINYERIMDSGYASIHCYFLLDKVLKRNKK